MRTRGYAAQAADTPLAPFDFERRAPGNRDVLIATGAISNLIREGKTFQIPSMMQVGRGVGMVSLNDALMELVTKKLVEPEEALAKSVDKSAFEALLKRGGANPRARAMATQ